MWVCAWLRGCVGEHVCVWESGLTWSSYVGVWLEYIPTTPSPFSPLSVFLAFFLFPISLLPASCSWSIQFCSPPHLFIKGGLCSPTSLLSFEKNKPLHCLLTAQMD